MNKILKLNEEDRRNSVFVSDFHLNHDRDFLWKPRGFNSVHEHFEWIKSQWKEHITPETIVFNLGDVCFGDPKGELFDNLSRWECKKHYVLWGNHNSGTMQCYKKARQEYFNTLSNGRVDDLISIGRKRDISLAEVYPLDYNNVVFCGNDLVIRAGRNEIHCSHFPKRIWDHLGRGALHVSGHSHGSDKARRPEANSVGKSFDVGVENAIRYGNKFCFTYQEVLDICSKKDIVVVDHHDSSTNKSR